MKNRLYLPLSNLLLILLLVSGCSMFGHQHNDAPPPPAASPAVNDVMNLPSAEVAAAPVVALPPANQDLAKPMEINPNARYKIAILVPLSGNAAKIGRQIVDAAQMAVLESGSKDFQLVPLDTSATQDGANVAADQAVAQHANIILGPVFAGDVAPVAAKAKAADIRVISFSNNKSVAGGNVYVLGLVPEQQVNRIIKYAGENGIKGFSTFLPGNAFGTQLAAAVKKLAGAAGGSLIKNETYSGDYDTAAHELSDAFGQKSITLDRRSQALVVAEGGDKLPALLAALDKVGLSTNSIRILGTSFWDREEIITSKPADGAWFVSTPYEQQDAFTMRFNKNYNYKPEDIAALGYDAANLAMETVSQNLSDNDLKRNSGFRGVKGIYKFNRDNVDIRSYAVYEISNGGAHVISPAPDRF